MKKLLYTLLGFVSITLLGVLLLFVLDRSITDTYSKQVYTDINQVPHKKAALVLGTSKYAWGRENLFFNYRIDAAVSLYQAGKIDAIIVSGDNSRQEYDEPTDMRDDLIKRGVPEAHITLDYAGFRTLDSIVRAEAIFDLNDFIIISQRFHVLRALYIADKKKINAIAFEAKNIAGVFGLRVRLREVLARFKAFLDLHIFGTEPKFYGDKVEVIYR
ncbi:MAG: YdcF family protein [Epsilonproteobacteria bacterium]|nr:YdcF family protein [Campylobacterota bacterium]